MIPLNSLIAWVRLALCGICLCGNAWAQTSDNPLHGLSDQVRMDPYSYAKNKSGVSDAVVKPCMDSAKKASQTGNSVIDMRCALVAFEVCIHKANGTVSQSQDSAKQCKIMQGLGGASTCQQPCAEAAQLPVGGSGVVTTPSGTYTGLTPFAVTCYKETLGKSSGIRSPLCARNEALQCLMNGSSSPEVNAAIRKERSEQCIIMHRESPQAVCAACVGDKPRVDYAPGKIDIDAKYCSPEMQAQKLCSMTQSTGELGKSP